MTRKEIRDYILRRVWVDDPAAVPARILADIVTAVNASLQLLHLDPAAKFFTQIDVPVTIPGGSNSVALPSTIQTVLAVRLPNDEPLSPVYTLDDIRYYRRRFEGATTETAGTPAAFLVETRRNTASGDAVDATLFVAPTPSATTTFTVETRGEAPNYTGAELEDDIAVIGIAHRYVETLFLPVAVYEATRFEWFEGGQSLRESLREAATAALRAQGLASPWPETPYPAREVAQSA